MSTKSQINRIRDKIKEVVTSPAKDWFDRTVNKSAKLRILRRKLHNLEVARTKGR